jgi:hypothetical protein
MIAPWNEDDCIHGRGVERDFNLGIMWEGGNCNLGRGGWDVLLEEEGRRKSGRNNLGGGGAC